MRTVVHALVAVGICSVAVADVIVDQPWDGVAFSARAQVYPDFPDFDVFQLDDFSIDQAYAITNMIGPGVDVGIPEANIAVVGEIWDGLPGVFGGRLVMTSVDGFEDPVTHTLFIDFGGQVLGAGEYWIAAYVVREFGAGGSYNWYRTNDDNPNGSEQWFYNPGGGFGLGTDPVPGSVVFDTPADMAFVLEGDLVLDCMWDLTEPEGVGPEDLVLLLGAWGQVDHPADFVDPPGVGPEDLIVLLGHWGPMQDCNQNGLDDVCELEMGFSPDCNANGILDACERFEDCNRNGVLDECDIADGISADCNANGVPDECEPFEDCNGNGIPDECDPFEDCNGNGIPDECDIADGASEDCNGNGIPDECERGDCNDNGIPDECETDCNRNGVPDDCDIADGTSLDCNRNGLPDECELDCNENGIPDDCDIADGASFDCNRDGIPDDCESVLGDLNDDGAVGTTDLLILLATWGCTECAADFDCDGIVSVGDLLILLGNWG